MKVSKWISISLALALAIILYSPTILYGVRLLGLGLASPSIDGRYIEMSPWWIAVSSPTSFQRKLFGEIGNDRLFFVKARGWLPGFDEKLVVSKAKGEPTQQAVTSGKLLELRWGQLLLVARNPADQFEHGFVQGSGLFLTATSVEVFREILAIRSK